jgi:hypothetical protein
MSRLNKLYCHQSCKVGVFIKCQYYQKWLTDSTMRSWCYSKNRSYKPINQNHDR